MPFRVPSLRRILLVGSALACLLVSMASCGSSKRPVVASGLTYRAFVSNPLEVGFGGNGPALQIVDALTDLISPSSVSLQGMLVQPQLMAVSPNLRYTLVFSPTGNQAALVDNSTEGIASIGGSSVPAITLPGPTVSMFISMDETTAYAAVPDAPVVGQAPGAVVVMNITNGTILATIPVVSARYVVQSHNGSYVLAFSDNSNTATLISPSLVGSNTDPRTTICCFDHPVWAVFSAEDSTAYVFNCGPQCGGAAAGITPLSTSSLIAGAPVPVSGADYGIQYGNTLYVAGSPPGQKCGSGTAAAHCGTLNLVNLNSFTLQNPSPILIADGTHTHMEVSQDGQLYIGSQGCTNVDVSGGEVRGCFTIFNTVKSTTLFPPQAGDVTGIAPVPGRPVVYVVQNAQFFIYDTQTNQIEFQIIPAYIAGQPYDVKMVDPAQGF